MLHIYAVYMYIPKNMQKLNNRTIWIVMVQENKNRHEFIAKD